MKTSKGFDLSAVFGEVSKMDTGNSGVLQMIPAEQIHPNEKNFYDVTDIDGLIDAILLDGLQSPLVVNKAGEGNYIIISGHRRFAALSKIMKAQLRITAGKLFADEIAAGNVPCLVNEYKNEQQAELALIRANSDTRILTSAEKAKQIERVEELLYQLKEQGHEFPGKMRDYVAEACKVSASKIARLKVINDGLISTFAKHWQSGKLKESPAYALAKLPEVQQSQINLYFAAKGTKPEYMYENEINRLAETLNELENTPPCKKDKAPCSHKAGRWERIMSSGVYSYNPCATTCCDKCSNLKSCKHACPKLAEKVKRLKSDAREQTKQEKLAKAQKEAPTIELITHIWERFGEARRTSGKSVKEAFEAMERYYGSNSDSECVNCENGEAKITTYTNLPYGYSCYISTVESLIKAADLFDCSIDFLLCRTDEPLPTTSRLYRPEMQSSVSTLIPCEHREAGTCDQISGCGSCCGECSVTEGCPGICELYENKAKPKTEDDDDEYDND